MKHLRGWGPVRVGIWGDSSGTPPPPKVCSEDCEITVVLVLAEDPVKKLPCLWAAQGQGTGLLNCCSSQVEGKEVGSPAPELTSRLL